MCKFMFALFIALLSLYSLPSMAANCSGGTIIFSMDPSDKGYWIQGNVYTPANNDPLLIMQAVIQNDMDCDADYTGGITTGGVEMVSQISMRLNGGSCKDASTVTTPYPGIEWKLDGMRCAGNSIVSNTVKSGTGSRFNWPAGTVLGKARIVVNDEYWMQSMPTGQYLINFQPLSQGNTIVDSPAVNVTSTMGIYSFFNMQDTATCGMSFSTENLDFGKLTPADIGNPAVLGKGLYKELSVYYSCKNKALINGLYVRFDPENVVDAANGIFSANDRNGRKLNLQIIRVYEDIHVVPLNTNYKIYEPTQKDLDATATFRIYVKPSTPFPTGKVSTYLNVSLIYR
ncbi:MULTISPECIES: fimbrial protein [unclassified Enterobacter cloacae complex]|uniref:fimbrial protein n=1 Tax=unclassified Enterobacter cloacae complex TaxID=2757714 RepID=UPI0018730EB9|nr:MULTISPECIES: fimbrial protein [unclassified Enterobacter cloacae complex]MBE4812114.1 fimbrial protein [Enterobacter cloacae complex sp. P44RS]MBE4829361.1 fimbrial protein [Enterobacter cloacae complex sp. P42RS]MBE4838429.1 fimbrial protein [Enterobacter cloacae complex sp. P46RS]MBE4842643.1 fimbrial protein [Enterobacter cloacae complex sp. P42C]